MNLVKIKKFHNLHYANIRHPNFLNILSEQRNKTYEKYRNRAVKCLKNIKI